MKEILDILRQELILCTRIRDISQQQRDVLAETLNGKAVSTITQQINELLTQLGKLEQRKQKLLAQNGEKTLKGLLLRQPFSAEKTLAGQLLTKLSGIIKELQLTSMNSRALLQRNMQYVEFSINVMTQASAGTTYTPPGGADSNTTHAKKMFDQSV